MGRICDVSSATVGRGERVNKHFAHLRDTATPKRLQYSAKSAISTICDHFASRLNSHLVFYGVPIDAFTDRSHARPECKRQIHYVNELRVHENRSITARTDLEM